MRIGVQDAAPATPRRRAADRPEAQAPAESRALTVIEPAAPSARAVPLSRYPAAPFLAHLIASRMQAPQTRALRRATPEDAMAAYASRPAGRSLNIVRETV